MRESTDPEGHRLGVTLTLEFWCRKLREREMDKDEPQGEREPGGCVLGAQTRQCSWREWSALMLLREYVKMHKTDQCFGPHVRVKWPQELC